MTAPLDIAALRGLLERATAGPWEVQDGCSWRRIGTARHDGNVLRPDTYSHADRHPDLSAGKGEDLYANLNLIVAAVNSLPALLARVAELEAMLSVGECICPKCGLRHGGSSQQDVGF